MSSTLSLFFPSLGFIFSVFFSSLIPCFSTGPGTLLFQIIWPFFKWFYTTKIQSSGNALAQSMYYLPSSSMPVTSGQIETFLVGLLRHLLSSTMKKGDEKIDLSSFRSSWTTSYLQQYTSKWNSRRAGLQQLFTWCRKMSSCSPSAQHSRKTRLSISMCVCVCELRDQADRRGPLQQRGLFQNTPFLRISDEKQNKRATPCTIKDFEKLKLLDPIGKKNLSEPI